MKTIYSSFLVILSILIVGFAPVAFAAPVDLAVTNFSVSSSSVQAGDTITVTTTISNLSNEYASGLAHLYLSSDPEITNDDTSLGWSVIAVLEPGQTASTSRDIVIPASMSTTTVYIGVIVPSSSADGDPDESNNTANLLLSITGAACTNDAFESDDSAIQAQYIAVNTSQLHNHCDDADDWFSFDAIAGQTYGIQNQPVSWEYATKLRLYDADGKTLLASSAWNAVAHNPRIIWTAPSSGRYFVKAKSAAGFKSVGINSSYKFTLANKLPDLVITDFSKSLYSNVVGGTALVYMNIANVGFSESGPFDVALYLSTDAEVTTDDIRIGYRRFDSLPVSQEGTLAWTLASYPPGLTAGTYYVGAIIDDKNEVMEYFENNNVSDHSVALSLTAPECEVDMYEENDYREYAKSITPNQSQRHNHCEDPYDWVYFDALQGKTYYIGATDSIGRNLGKGITVFDANGDKVISGKNQVSWTTQEAGRYYVLIYNNMGWTNSTWYTLSILDEYADLEAKFLYHTHPREVPRGGVLDKIILSVSNNGYIQSLAARSGFYLSIDDTVETTDTLIVTEPIPPLAVGEYYEKREILAQISPSMPLGAYYFGFIVDDLNQIPETDETNNSKIDLGNPITIIDPVCAPDSYDQDDVSGQAKMISVDEVQSRNFCDDGYDWAIINAQAGVTYSLMSDNPLTIGDSFNANMKILEADGVTVVATAEHTPTMWDRLRFVSFTADKTSIYYVKLMNGIGEVYETFYGINSNYTMEMKTCEIDSFEQDDSIAEAINIAVGDVQEHNHCDDGIDWLALSIPEAGGYVIETSDLGANGDTVLELYDTDGTTLLDDNDNVGRNKLNSKLVWSFDTPGTYYVAVKANYRGPNTGYLVSLVKAKGKVNDRKN